MARSGNVNITDEIKSRCNIVDVVGRVVELKRAGSNFKGRCPFHNEKTPSFVVSDQKQIYTCFGCHNTGDVIKFVQEYYGLDFKGAVEMLAKEYGIDISDAFGSSSARKDEFYEINRQAAIFFYKSMRQVKNQGYPYMRNRGLSDQTLHDFGIGYADDKWTSLTDYLTKEKGFPIEKLLEVGLVSKSKKGTYYDKFRNRVMFPIKNTAGKVIGFGGRIIGDGEPKYLNSQESTVFQKKNNLYGLDLTRKFVSDEDEIILVEGYMDVIALYQAGIRNVSASLGTALTENQATLIKRYTKNVILSYDADSAGQKAAMRGVDILYKENCRVRVLKVTDGKDPDEFIKKNGRDAFRQLTKNALPFGDFKLHYVRQGFDIRDEQQRLLYVEEAIRILKEMKPTEADLYIKKLAKETGISEEAIRREYSKNGDDYAKTAEHRPDKPDGVILHKKDISQAEMQLLRLMLLDTRFTVVPDDIRDSIFQNQSAAELYMAITENDDGSRPMDINRVKDMLEQDAVDLLNAVSDNLVSGNKEDAIYSDCINYIRRKKLERELEEINMRLELSDDTTNKDELDRLMLRQIEIQNIIKR